MGYNFLRPAIEFSPILFKTGVIHVLSSLGIAYQGPGQTCFLVLKIRALLDPPSLIGGLYSSYISWLPVPFVTPFVGFPAFRPSKAFHAGFPPAPSCRTGPQHFPPAAFVHLAKKKPQSVNTSGRPKTDTQRRSIEGPCLVSSPSFSMLIRLLLVRPPLL